MNDLGDHQPTFAEDLKRLLANALVEVPCAECGRYALTFERNQPYAAFECPACHRRTFMIRDETGCTILSETRLIRLVRFARSRRWFCPDHPGIPLDITQIRINPREPRNLTLCYLCRRGIRFFGRHRVHAGVINIDLMTLEAEMLASGG